MQVVLDRARLQESARDQDPVTTSGDVKAGYRKWITMTYDEELLVFFLPFFVLFFFQYHFLVFVFVFVLVLVLVLVLALALDLSLVLLFDSLQLKVPGWW